MLDKDWRKAQGLRHKAFDDWTEYTVYGIRCREIGSWNSEGGIEKQTQGAGLTAQGLL
jgi:hypothetical protein